MRLWHEKMIPFLPRQQLLGQHRECCALRGNGWGRKHATVDYVFQHSPMMLVAYHLKVLREMVRRGYRYDPQWEQPHYRGVRCIPYEIRSVPIPLVEEHSYPEHNQEYLAECLANLRRKGIVICVP
jgi:uncharacterized protein (TIGR02328 family)